MIIIDDDDGILLNAKVLCSLLKDKELTYDALKALIYIFSIIVPGTHYKTDSLHDGIANAFGISSANTMQAMNLLVHKGILHRIDYDINGDSKQYTINSKLIIEGIEWR